MIPLYTAMRVLSIGFLKKYPPSLNGDLIPAIFLKIALPHFPKKQRGDIKLFLDFLLQKVIAPSLIWLIPLDMACLMFLVDELLFQIKKEDRNERK